jgi:hypothetical protein
VSDVSLSVTLGFKVVPPQFLMVFEAVARQVTFPRAVVALLQFVLVMPAKVMRGFPGGSVATGCSDNVSGHTGVVLADIPGVMSVPVCVFKMLCLPVIMRISMTCPGAGDQKHKGCDQDTYH